MADDFVLVKEVIDIEKLDDTNKISILIDTDDKLPDDITYYLKCCHIN